MTLVVLVATFAVLMAIGVPVAFAMLSSSVAAILVQGTFPLMIVVQRIAPGLDSFPLLAIPLFVLAGNIMNTSGIAARIFDFASAAIGHVKGGLAHVNVLASMIFAGMSGVASADAAGLGKIELEQMQRAGYKAPFAAAVTAASSVVGPIIPPSVIMVVYSVQASVPVTDMFLAGLIPGVLFCLMLMAGIFVMAHTGHIDVPSEPKAAPRVVFRAFLKALPALLAPALLLLGLFLGVATPTELGALVAAYAIVLGFAYGDLTLRDVLDAFVSTVRTCGVLIFILAASIPFGWIIAVSGISTKLTDFAVSAASSPWQVLLLLNVLLLVAGAFIETTALMLIAIPMFLPAVLAMGIDPIQFGVILIINCLVGAITPPFGLILFVMMDVAKVSLRALTIAILPFYIPILIFLVLISLIPAISLTIPNLFGG